MVSRAGQNGVGAPFPLSFLPLQMLCCAIYGFGRLSRPEFGSEKMTRRNKCDVQSGHPGEEDREGERRPFFCPPRAINSSKAEGDSNSEWSGSFRDSPPSWSWSNMKQMMECVTSCLMKCTIKSGGLRKNVA